MGLHDEKDISVRGLEAAKKCEKVYLEGYTTKINTDLDKLRQLLGKEVKELERKQLEERAEEIIEEAKEKNVAVLVGGDALVATTHVSLVMEARKKEIKTKIIHGSSIYSAVGETGLQLYKFGKTTTLAFPRENYNPKSCYETIVDNQKLGLHTLVLLDVNKERERYMDIPTGLEILEGIEKERGKGIVSEETKIVSACQLGGDETIKYGTVKELKQKKELKNKTPAVLIFPGELHFMEEEFLEDLER